MTRTGLARRPLVAASLLACLLVQSASGQVVGPNRTFPMMCKEEKAPTVAVQGSSILALWTGCPGARGVASSDGGATWQDVGNIPWASHVYAPAAMCAGDSGRFYAIATILEIGQGLAIGAQEGRFQGAVFGWRTLSNPVPFPGDTDYPPGSLDIAFDPVTRNLYVAYTKVVDAAYTYRTMFTRSTDQGATWDPPQVLTGRESSGARVVVGADGEVAVVWENYIQKAVIGRRSPDHGLTFGSEFPLVPVLDNLTEPGSWRSDYIRVNPLMAPNNSDCIQAPAAFSIAVDRSDGPRRGTWYLVTTEHASGTVGPRLGAVSEVEVNDHFAAATPITIGLDVNGGVSGAHGNQDWDPYSFEGVAGQTIWVNGYYFSTPYSRAPFAFGIMCGDDTTRISAVVCMNIFDEGTGPSMIYTLPTTGRYYLSAHETVFSSIGYRMLTRTYTVSPTSVARDHRDVLLCSSSDGGATWSPKVRVSDGPLGNEECFPEVAVDEEGRVHVAWYDRRDALECGAEANTYWSWSEDGGATFAPGVRVSELSSQSGNINLSRWLVGDRLGLAAANGKVHVLWTRIPNGGGADIWAATITDVPTAVLLAGLRAEWGEGSVELAWRASDVGEVREFRMHRSEGAGEYAVVAEVRPVADGEYRWEDTGVVAGRTYRYRIEAVRSAGGSVWEGPVELAIGRPGVRLAWRGAVPNPFDAEVVLELETPDRAGTRVRVYDVTGHRVAELKPEDGEGRLRVRWDGRDRSGRVVAPGVYLVRAELGDRTVTRQVVRMK